jgi:hypothetical protein
LLSQSPESAQEELLLPSVQRPLTHGPGILAQSPSLLQALPTPPPLLPEDELLELLLELDEPSEGTQLLPWQIVLSQSLPKSQYLPSLPSLQALWLSTQ